MLISSRRRKIIAFALLLVEILALMLIIFGAYTRFSGAGDPVGSTYILVGGFVGLGGALVTWFVFRRGSRIGRVQIDARGQPKEVREEEQGPMER